MVWQQHSHFLTRRYFWTRRNVAKPAASDLALFFLINFHTVYQDFLKWLSIYSVADVTWYLPKYESNNWDWHTQKTTYRNVSVKVMRVNVLLHSHPWKQDKSKNLQFYFSPECWRTWPSLAGQVQGLWTGTSLWDSGWESSRLQEHRERERRKPFKMQDFGSFQNHLPHNIPGFHNRGLYCVSDKKT